MGLMDNFLQQLGQGDTIHDFQHASRVFTHNNYELAPKHQFLFYARFTLNHGLNMDDVFPLNKLGNLNVMVKKFGMPRFTFDTKILNAYNRPNIVQTKVKYDPVQITFHDDAADTVRRFWYDYYAYYYRDSDYEDSVYEANDKYGQRASTQWGYQPHNAEKSNQHLITKIDLFSFHNKRYSQITLFNPMIQNFAHGEHDYSQTAGIVESQMTVAYESVKYQVGQVTSDGFIDMMELYDHSPSPLTPGGGTTDSILGPGGVLNQASSAVEQFNKGNYAGAAFIGLRAVQGFKGKDLGAIAGAAGLGLVTDMLRGGNPMSGFSVPSLGSLGNSITGGASKLFNEGIGAVGGALKNVAGGVGNIVSGAIGSITGGGQSNPVLTAAQKVTGAISSNGAKIGASVSGLFSGGGNSGGSFSSAFPNDLGDFFG